MTRRDLENIPERYRDAAMSDAAILNRVVTFDPQAVRSALAVMVLTPHIREYLDANDPMAMRQAREALGITSKGGDVIEGR